MNRSLQPDDTRGQPVPGSGISLLPLVGEHPGFTLWRVSMVLVAAMFALALVRAHGWVPWTVLAVMVLIAVVTRRAERVTSRVGSPGTSGTARNARIEGWNAE